MALDEIEKVTRFQQGFSGASVAPERGAGCSRLNSSPAEGGVRGKNLEYIYYDNGEVIWLLKL